MNPRTRRLGTILVILGGLLNLGGFRYFSWANRRPLPPRRSQVLTEMIEAGPEPRAVLGPHSLVPNHPYHSKPTTVTKAPIGPPRSRQTPSPKIAASGPAKPAEPVASIHNDVITENSLAWEPFKIMTPGGPNTPLNAPAYVLAPQRLNSSELLTEEEFLNMNPRRTERFKDVPRKYVLADTRVTTQLTMARTDDASNRRGKWFSPFTRAFVLGLEHGFLGDNSIFGPAVRSEPKKEFFALSRWWLGYPRAYRGSAPGIEHRDIGIAVAVGGWGATAFQHFVIDVLPKLALVYDKLTSPEWVRANVSLVTNLGRNKAPYWFLRELKLMDRTLPMMGWPKKAKFIYRCKLCLFPNFAPAPVIAGKARTGVYPRGTMLPIQKALGVFKETRRDRIVYIPRGGRRGLDAHVDRSLRGALANIAIRHNAITGESVKVESFRFKTRERARDLFRRAIAVVGPHGGGFSNLVFAKPGTLVVEFIPLFEFSRETKGGRPSKFVYYGLAQACGMDYWFVRPENFHFDKGGMMLDVKRVANIVSRALEPRRSQLRARGPAVGG